MSQIIPYSQRFGRNIRLTHHVRDRMKKRGVSEAMLMDLIEEYATHATERVRAHDDHYHVLHDDPYHVLHKPRAHPTEPTCSVVWVV